MAKHSDKDKKMAAYLKSKGIVRTSQICPNCYRMIVRDTWKSRYTHMCR